MNCTAQVFNHLPSSRCSFSPAMVELMSHAAQNMNSKYHTCLIFTMQDWGGAELSRTSKIIILTSHTWGAFGQIVVWQAVGDSVGWVDKTWHRLELNSISWVVRCWRCWMIFIFQSDLPNISVLSGLFPCVAPDNVLLIYNQHLTDKRESPRFQMDGMFALHL